VTVSGRVDVTGVRWRPYGRATPVLDDVSFSVPAGRRVLLVGASGSGKSTLLRALAGVLTSADAGEYAGSVLVDGADLSTQPGSVGLVLQEPGAAVVASSLERDVAFGLENLRVAPALMPTQVATALTSVGLTMDPSSPTEALSGGELQRLALAGALVMAPRVLLLDEPSAMLDDQTAAGVRDVVDAVAREHSLTVVVVEHRLEGWIPFVDDALVLTRDGRVAAFGPVQQILEEHRDLLLDEGVWVPGAPLPRPVVLTGWLPPTRRRPQMSSATVPIAPRSAAATDAAPPGVPPAGESSITASGLTIVRRSQALTGPPRETVVVQDIGLSAPAGGLGALVGPSGSGKSTLLAALAGLIETQGGSISVSAALATPCGQRTPAAWSSIELAERMAWVPQTASRTMVARTVIQEVMATSAAITTARPGGPAADRGEPEAGLRERAERLLTGLGLGDRLDIDPRHLSGGEQRRLAIASAALHAPAIYLADEPTVGQDRHTWAAVMGTLDSLADHGSAVVVTTHDPLVVERATHVVALPPSVPRIDDLPPSRRVLAERAGSLALLVAVLLLVGLPAILTSWRQIGWVLLAEAGWSVVALSAPPPGRIPQGRIRRVAARLVAPLLAAGSVVWSTWLLGGHDVEAAVTAGLRVLAVVAPGVIVLPYADPDRLGDELRGWLHLPPRGVVAFTAVLGRVQHLDAIWREVVAVRRVRGLGSGRTVTARFRALAATTVAMVTGALTGAATLAVAMDARGFAAARRRTAYGAVRWGFADWVAVLAGVSVLVVAVLT
jgi:energy-coupling factor transporter ATP-binding protein EcfA2/energy-coupling factor transporter transmembrane protein EcfT